VKDINDVTNESGTEDGGIRKGEGRKEEKRKIGRNLERSKHIWECLYRSRAQFNPENEISLHVYTKL
jgi:hypothetical protein